MSIDKYEVSAGAVVQRLQQHREEALQPWLACHVLCHCAHTPRTRSVPQSSPLQTSLHCCKSMPTVLTLPQPQPHDQHLNQELNWILLSSQQDQIKKLGNISCETGQCIRRDGNNRDTFSSISVQLPGQLFERRHSLCQPRQRGYRDD